MDILLKAKHKIKKKKNIQAAMKGVNKYRLLVPNMFKNELKDHT